RLTGRPTTTSSSSSAFDRAESDARSNGKVTFQPSPAGTSLRRSWIAACCSDRRLMIVRFDEPVQKAHVLHWDTANSGQIFRHFFFAGLALARTAVKSG